MSNSLKTNTQQIVQTIIFWAVAMALYSAFRFYGMSEVKGIVIKPEFQEAMHYPNLLRLFTLSGALVGLLFALISIAFEKLVSDRISIGLRLFSKTALHLLALILVSALAKAAASRRFGIDLQDDALFKDKTFQAILIYVLLVSLVFSFIKIANEKFGKGVFLKMLLGRYKKPQEEKRIFMFLDLKSSTTIAEKLGHFKYSQLIQDCFYDLNEVVPMFGAEIYQYVGDEAVLCWPYKKGLANNNCVRTYFEFAAKLAEKADYYTQKYGLVPLFKAGLHGGTLMVAEVGVVKKELAFHGDVINTSARIQSECNNYKVPILISEFLKNELANTASFELKHMGNVLLKGKENKLNIYTVLEA